jgi:hypothetical protein
MELKMNKFTPFFIPDSHKCLCESGLSGPVLALRGQRHVGDFADVDGLQALQAVIQGYMINSVLAGYPRAANYIEGSHLSRGWQTMEDRKAKQTAAD